MQKLIITKTGANSLMAASIKDQEIIDGWKTGESKSVEVKSFKPRNLAMHRKYWALIDIAKDYWSPPASTIIKNEYLLFEQFADFLKSKDVNGDAIIEAVKSFLKERLKEKKKKMECYPITREAFHRHVKIRLGRYELQRTERGVFKKTHSISFGSMNQDEFDIFYKEAVNVCWDVGMKYIFKNKDHVDEVVMAKLSGF